LVLLNCLCLQEFLVADTHIRESLPPIITAVFSIVPPLLATIIDIQNRLLGVAYTAIHQYCLENDFQSPPPPMESVVADWEMHLGPVSENIGAFNIIKSGRHLRHALTSDGKATRPMLSPASIVGNGAQRRPPGLTPSTSVPDFHRSPITQDPAPDLPSSGASSGSGVATDFTLATKLRSLSAVSTPASRGASGYFGHNTQRQQTSELASAARKKKPPPPPPKRPLHDKQEDVVVALYDFQSEGHGDLSFQEGDLIKIVQKTATDQDWWVGELRGVQGSFPANYCKPLQSSHA
jgi:amphiphysin